MLNKLASMLSLTVLGFTLFLSSFQANAAPIRYIVSGDVTGEFAFDFPTERFTNYLLQAGGYSYQLLDGGRTQSCVGPCKLAPIRIGNDPFGTARLSFEKGVLEDGGELDLSFMLRRSFSGTALYTPFTTPNAVPLPASVWLFGSALFGMLTIAKRRAA